MRLLLFLAFAALAHADPATVRVFVALADNEHQGLVPVPAKIGNGTDYANNLYWGCDEALPPVFKRSTAWKLESVTAGPKASILQRITFLHRSGQWRLIADAYRGADIRECLVDYFAALASDDPTANVPLVAYLGHNGLMDFALPEAATAKRGPGRDAIVFCCKSRDYFAAPLAAVQAHPVALTADFMYPGGFLLLAALDGWTQKENAEQIRQRVATAYARNQKISVKAATTVFAKP